MGKIKTAIVGVGNCASALIQGIAYYSQDGADRRPGLAYPSLGGYLPADIEICTAFDVDERKVGKPLGEAIFSEPNCAEIFFPDLPDIPVKVKMGESLDGVSEHMNGADGPGNFKLSSETSGNITEELRRSGAEVLINFLPVGSERASRRYAEACLEAGVGFINAIPVFIASDPDWAERFTRKGIPIIGDDTKSQLGATIVHRVLADVFDQRGIAIDRTYQLNFGGNTDFRNMLERDRLVSKKISKTQSVQSQLDIPLDAANIHVGPSDYVPWLHDSKVCYIRIEGTGFGDQPIDLELRLSVQDSPNAAGVIIDAIRCMKLALDRGIGGPLYPVCSYTMKSPPRQTTDEEAKILMEEFIKG